MSRRTRTSDGADAQPAAGRAAGSRLAYGFSHGSSAVALGLRLFARRLGLLLGRLVADLRAATSSTLSGESVSPSVGTSIRSVSWPSGASSSPPSPGMPPAASPRPPAERLPAASAAAVCGVRRECRGSGRRLAGEFLGDLTDATGQRTATGEPVPRDCSASPTTDCATVSPSTSSIRAMGALSPARGPTLTMRV